MSKLVSDESEMLDPERISPRTEAAKASATGRPFWKRLCLLAVAAMGIGVGVAACRFQLRRRGTIDRIRSTIAADLHDEVGPALTQIVLLSRKIRDAATENAELRKHSSRLTTISRSLVDSLSDFVWSIDAAEDRLSDLSLRIKSYAQEMLEDAGLRLRFSGPEPTDARKLV